MMKTIYKYEIDPTHTRIEMPIGAEILTVQTQNNVPQIWALVETFAMKEFRYFEVFGTGHEIPVDMGVERKYIGTFQLEGGSLVFHLFERIN